MDIAVYNLTVKNEKKKAIDLVDLKNFLEEKKYIFNPMNIDPKQIDPELTVQEHIGNVSIAILSDIMFTVDKHLGLIREPEPEPETEYEPEFETTSSDNIKEKAKALEEKKTILQNEQMVKDNFPEPPKEIPQPMVEKDKPIEKPNIPHSEIDSNIDNEERVTI